MTADHRGEVRPCPLRCAHEAHQRTTGDLPARCPGSAPRWPDEPVAESSAAAAAEHRRFGTVRPGPVLAHEPVDGADRATASPRQPLV